MIARGPQFSCRGCDVKYDRNLNKFVKMKRQMSSDKLNKFNSTEQSFSLSYSFWLYFNRKNDMRKVKVRNTSNDAYVGRRWQCGLSVWSVDTGREHLNRNINLDQPPPPPSHPSENAAGASLHRNKILKYIYSNLVAWICLVLAESQCYQSQREYEWKKLSLI